MGAGARIILGTRGSELALAQTRLVENALRAQWRELEIIREIVRTRGDESLAPIDQKAGRKGMFTREIEQRLLARHIDVAVHSAKDLPSAISDNLEICATLPRGKTDDVLITKAGFSLTNLPPGSIVATGSVRRQFQLRRLRSDLEIVDLRGNVPTRLRKLAENDDWSGIILARAGLERLGFRIEEQTFRLATLDGNAPPSDESGKVERLLYDFAGIMSAEILSANDFVPAGGQGIIALEIRRDDPQAREIATKVNHRATTLALRAEREFLRLLDGDCNSPVGVHALMNESQMAMRAQVFHDERAEAKIGSVFGAPNEPEAVAQDLMKVIYG